ncbi:MAG: hypothetical protein LBR33_01545 [Propionibacteriaceae bacterium]|jgi:tetratricopeptide (TPR) repeat protein|nr:hypothetical protein [Propionibacteriaceae bacterium]
MARSLIEANAAIGRVRAMPYGRARSEAAQREVRRVEREGPDEAKAYALTSLVEALTWGDEYEKAFLPFTQLLRWWDEHPEHFDHYDQSVLFWEFGWIMSDLPQIPTVGRARIEAALDDMERRFAVANRGMERVWSTRLDWALLRGGDDVDRVFTEWLTLPIDDEDSCAACHEALRAEYLLWRGKRAEAIAVLEAAAGSDVACSREPAAMLTDLALAYLEEGRLADVEETVPKALAELRKAVSTSLGSAYARVIEVYARSRQPGLALDLLAERAKDLVTGTPYRRLVVLRRVVAATAALIAVGHSDYPVTLPDVPAATVAELHTWALDKARPVAAQFDQRNGTTEQSRQVELALAVTPAPRRLEFALPCVAGEAERLVTERLAAALVEPPPEAAKTPVNSADVTVNARPARLRAEECLAVADTAGAAAAFEEAARQAQEEGLLRESGWEWAEAARCHQLRRQRAQASAAYAQALSRLRAAGAPVEELARVLVTWAPTVRKRDEDSFVNEAMAASARLPVVVSDRDDGPTLADVAGFGLTFRPLRRQLHARADIEDALARVLATWGGEASRTDALDRARSAAEIYASVGAPVEAAHSNWLVGRLAAVDGATDEAVEQLELAAVRFQQAGRREFRHYAEVTEELAEVLRESGQYRRADEVLRGQFDF